jgi:hypothetical protein
MYKQYPAGAVSPIKHIAALELHPNPATVARNRRKNINLPPSVNKANQQNKSEPTSGAIQYPRTHT